MSTAAAPAAAVIDPFERFPPGQVGRMLFWIAVAFSAFQVATAAHVIDLPSQIVRAVHVGFLLLLGFALIATLKAKTPAGRAWFWLLAALGFGTGLYNWVFYADLIRRSSERGAG